VSARAELAQLAAPSFLTMTLSAPRPAMDTTLQLGVTRRAIRSGYAADSTLTPTSLETLSVALMQWGCR
jgi:hypothetical protein